MAATHDPRMGSSSRLNRYFHSDAPHPRHVRPPPHASTMVRLPPKVMPGPYRAAPHNIDGAACKTSTWTYKHVSPKNSGISVIEKGAKVRPDKVLRKPLQKLNWKEGPWPKGFSPSQDYLDLDTRAPSSSSCSDISPGLAAKRVSLLASNKQYKEAADFIHKLPSVTVRSALAELPMETLVASMPVSLPVIEALYCMSGNVSPQQLHVDAVVWQMVKFFAQQEECLTGDIRWEFCGPFVVLCRDVLRVVARIQPGLRRVLLKRRKLLEKAIEGMGHHGLVGTSDESLTTLHDALKLELEKVLKSYTAALGTLQELSTIGKGHVTKGPAPIQASHQRQLSISPNEIQERLIKNKSLLNIVEPTLGNHSLDILLGILQRRIEHDKDSLFQFTQLRKESKDIASDAIVAPILMRYAHGCDQVLDMLREVMEESGYDVTQEEDEGSDVSGYHSDSDSAIMMSGNSPYVTKHARFNFLTRSVRDRSRVGTRMSLHTVTSSDTAGALANASLFPSSSSSASSSDSHSFTTEASKRTSPSSTLRREEQTNSSSSNSSSSEGHSNGSGADPSELEALRKELTQARQTIRSMHERERDLKKRLNEESAQKMTLRREIESVVISQAAQIPEATEIPLAPRPNTKLPSKIDIQANLQSTETLVRAPRNEFNRSKRSGEGHQKNWSPATPSEYPKSYKPSNLNRNVVKVLPPTDPQTVLGNQRKRILSIECNPPPPSDTNKYSPSSNSQATVNPNCLVQNAANSLVRRYGSLFSTSRVETLEALDKLDEMRNASELKSKLVFSVVVLAFRSVSASAATLRQDVRRILGVAPSSSSPQQVDQPPALESAMVSVISSNVDSHDLTTNVEDVCQQIWATLFDYPGLKDCEGLLRYIKECVRVAWGLVNQSPAYAIEYEARSFQDLLHVRFHTSDATRDAVRTYLWPSLVEGNGGGCVYKGVVIT